MLVNMFCIAPAFPNKVELAMKFWQENNLNPARLAVGFEQALHHGKIQLIIENLAITAIHLTFIWAFETGTFLFFFF
jgi:hypothetical protein